MPQTDSKPGFRLPWSPDANETDVPEDGAAQDTAPVEHPTAEESVTPDMIETTAPAPARRPTKFMADLSKAMQTAAEASRDETMARFIADSQGAVEQIEATATEEAAALRRRADDDVATIRDWSKAEIAQIREETEARIAARKKALDVEMDAHGAIVESRRQHVAGTIEAFRAEMDAFFERLLAEQDPTRIATMAETMPDPPDLAGVAASIAEPAVEPFDVLQVRLAQTPVEVAPEPNSDVATPEVAPDQAAEAEAAMAARLEFAAAEAEALAYTDEPEDDGSSAAEGESASDDDVTPSPVGGDKLANADAGTLPGPVEGDRVKTRVVVVGLVSVASIATFKRGLSRTAGVTAVGVASGPDGEFVFTVEHEESLDISATVTGLPGFEAHITAESAGTLEVAAHDHDTGD